MHWNIAQAINWTAQKTAQNPPAAPTQLAMATTSKPFVLILGGTGWTGRSIVDGLIKSGNFVRSQLKLGIIHI